MKHWVYLMIVISILLISSYNNFIIKNTTTNKSQQHKNGNVKFKMIINNLSGDKMGLDRANRACKIFESEGIKVEKMMVGGEISIKECKLDDTDGIIIVGGDGTINRIMNDLLSRKDYKKQISIGIIPSGTGNSLANDLYGRPLSPEEAASIIIKKNIKKIDISLIEEKTKSTYFLSMVGLVNVAKRAENYRYLGSYRYKVASILESLFPSFEYKGQLTINGKDTYNGKFPFMIICNTEHISQTTIACPGAKLDDGKIGISFVNNSINFLQLLSVENGLDDGSHVLNKNVVYRDDVREISFQTETPQSINVDGEVDYVHTPFKIKVLPKHIPIFI